MRSLLVVFLSLSFIPAFSQLRHVEGVKGVEAGYIVTGHGRGYNVAFMKHSSNKFYWKASAFMENGTDQGIGYQSLGLDIYGSFTVTKIAEFLYLNVNAGMNASNDSKTSQQFGSEFKIPTTFKFGVLGGIETEWFINDKFAIIVYFNQKLLLKEDFGNNRYFITGSLRYNF